ISVTLLYNPARSPVDRQLVEGVVTGSTMRLSIENQLRNGLQQFGDLIELAPAEVRANIRTSSEEDAAPLFSAPALSVVSAKPSAARITVQPNTLQQTIPGYTVMFVYFLIGTVVASVKLERNTGVLRRLLVTPMRRADLLAGKTFSALVIGVLQVATMFAIGVVVFGMGLGHAPVALFVHTVAVVLSAVCIGLAAAAFRIERGINVMLIVGALIAGCAFPADWLPPVLRTVNVVLPQTWAMQGYQDLITRGMGFVDVLPEIGVLLGFAAVFFAIAVWKFDLEG
ncbi:MAG TPA: ABC transporter permease, partial [Chloroflexi bacterium]|nr:ABC transporter permease [Chloroflexota bacterium]